MRTYSVTAPNGKTYSIEGPEGASKEDVIWALTQKMPGVDFNAPPTPRDRTAGEVVSDIGASLKTGVGSLAQFPGQLGALTGLASPDNAFIKYGEQLKAEAEAAKSEPLKQRQRIAQQQIQAAEGKGLTEEALAAIKAYGGDPALLTSFLAEQVPQLLGPAVVGKGAQLGVKALAPAATAATLGKAGVATAVGTGATMQGASVGMEQFERAYKTLVDQGVPESQAKDQALNLARASGASAAALSLLIQKLPGASSFEKSLLAGQKPTGALLGRTAVGGLKEGATEGLEEAGGQLAANVAQKTIDPTQVLSAGVGTAGALGALGGAGVGGITGALTGAPPESVATTPAGALTPDEQRRMAFQRRQELEAQDVENKKAEQAKEAELRAVQREIKNNIKVWNEYELEQAKAQEKQLLADLDQQKEANSTARKQRLDDLRAAFPADYSNVESIFQLEQEKRAIEAEPTPDAKRLKKINDRLKLLYAPLQQDEQDTQIEEPKVRGADAAKRLEDLKAAFPADYSNVMQVAPLEQELAALQAQPKKDTRRIAAITTQLNKLYQENPTFAAILEQQRLARGESQVPSWVTLARKSAEESAGVLTSTEPQQMEMNFGEAPGRVQGPAPEQDEDARPLPVLDKDYLQSIGVAKKAGIAAKAIRPDPARGITEYMGGLGDLDLNDPNDFARATQLIQGKVIGNDLIRPNTKAALQTLLTQNPALAQQSLNLLGMEPNPGRKYQKKVRPPKETGPTPLDKFYEQRGLSTRADDDFDSPITLADLVAKIDNLGLTTPNLANAWFGAKNYAGLKLNDIIGKTPRELAQQGVTVRSGALAKALDAMMPPDTAARDMAAAERKRAEAEAKGIAAANQPRIDAAAESEILSSIATAQEALIEAQAEGNTGGIAMWEQMLANYRKRLEQIRGGQNATTTEKPAAEPVGGAGTQAGDATSQQEPGELPDGRGAVGDVSGDGNGGAAAATEGGDGAGVSVGSGRGDAGSNNGRGQPSLPAISAQEFWDDEAQYRRDENAKKGQNIYEPMWADLNDDEKRTFQDLGQTGENIEIVRRTHRSRLLAEGIKPQSLVPVEAPVKSKRVRRTKEQIVADQEKQRADKAAEEKRKAELTTENERKRKAEEYWSKATGKQPNKAFSTLSDENKQRWYELYKSKNRTYETVNTILQQDRDVKLEEVVAKAFKEQGEARSKLTEGGKFNPSKVMFAMQEADTRGMKAIDDENLKNALIAAGLATPVKLTQKGSDFLWNQLSKQDSTDAAQALVDEVIGEYAVVDTKAAEEAKPTYPQKSIEDFFKPELLKTTEPGYKSREKIVYMKIDDFLAMSSFMEREESQRARESAQQGIKWESLPRINMDETNVGKVRRVVGHEGRHRALVLKEAGFDVMPVVLVDPAIRWDQQVNPDNFDYVKDWPVYLQAQTQAKNPNAKIRFPVPNRVIAYTKAYMPDQLERMFGTDPEFDPIAFAIQSAETVFDQVGEYKDLSEAIDSQGINLGDTMADKGIKDDYIRELAFKEFDSRVKELRAEQEAKAAEVEAKAKAEAERVEKTKALEKVVARQLKLSGGDIVFNDGEDILISVKNQLGGIIYLPADKTGVWNKRFDSTDMQAKLTQEQTDKFTKAVSVYENKDLQRSMKHPKGPFSKDKIIGVDGVDPKYVELLRAWSDALGMRDVEIMVAPMERAEGHAEFADKYKTYGDYRTMAFFEAESSSTDGLLTTYGTLPNTFRLRLKAGMSPEQTIEVLAHEFGHLIHRTAFSNASKDIQNAVFKDYETWLKQQKGKKFEDVLQALRTKTTAQQSLQSNTKASLETVAEQLSKRDQDYFLGFSEWFADNVARWATSSDKPVSIVERFFKDVAMQIRQFLAVLTGNKYPPSKAVKDFLDAMGPNDSNNWVMPGLMPVSPKVAPRQVLSEKDASRSSLLDPVAEVEAITGKPAKMVQQKPRPTAVDRVKEIAANAKDIGPREFATQTIRSVPGKITAFRTLAVDNLATVEQRLINAYSKGFRDSFGNINPIAFARQAMDAPRLAADFFKAGKIVLDKDGIVRTKESGPNFEGVLKSLKAYADKIGRSYEEVEGAFNDMLEAKRVVDLYRENDKREQDIQDLLAQGKKEQARRLEDKRPQLKIHMSKATAEELAAAFDNTPEFVKLRDQLNEIRVGVLELSRDAGVIDQETFEDWAANGDYVPFDRLVDWERGEYDAYSKKAIARGLAAFPKTKQFRGSYERPVNNIMDNYARTMEWMISRAVRNHASNALLKDMTALNFALPIKDPKQATMKNLVVHTFVDGKDAYHEVASEYDMMAFGAYPLASGPLVQMLAKTTRVLRSSITLLPPFAINQVIQDAQRAAIMSGTARPLQVIGKTLLRFPQIAIYEYSGKLKPKSYDELARAGIVGDFDFNAEKAAQEVRYNTGIQKREPWAKFINLAEKFTKASDLAARMAVYEQIKEEFGDTGRAEYAARELINFKRRGASAIISNLIPTVPFFNAYAQGMDVMYRQFFMPGATASGAEKSQARAAMVRTSMMIVGLSLAYALMMSDEPEYLKAENYVRDRNFLLPGGFKIPVPNEFGVVLKSSAEAAVNYYRVYGTDEERSALGAIKEYLTQLGTAVASPNVISPWPRVALEQFTNFDFFTGRDIDPERGSQKEPALRYGPNTSELAKTIGKLTDVSPYRIDHVMRGILGTTFSTTTLLVDGMLNPNLPDRPVHKLPFMDILMFRPEGSRTKSITYELLKEAEMAHATFTTLLKDDPAAAEKYLEAKGDVMAMRNYLKFTVDQLAYMRSHKNAIINGSVEDLGMTGAQKREAITEIEMAENELTKEIGVIRKAMKLN